MMRSILGLTTPEGNITRGTSSPVKRALQANHCRCRRRARPGREEVRGVRLFLLFFLFRLDEEDELLRRSSIAFMSARCCAHHGSLFATSRSAFSCAVGRGRRALCRQRRRHQRAPAQQREELPLRSAAWCVRSSAAPGQRDCQAAPPEVVSSVPVGRRARRAPPPPRRLRCPSSVPVGRRTSPAPHHGCDEGLRTAQPRRSSARVAATSGAVAPAASWRLQHDQPLADR